MSDLEMPIPCSTCGKQIELNDACTDNRGGLHCGDCYLNVAEDDRWEEAAGELDRSADSGTEWAVRFNNCGAARTMFVSECDSESEARRYFEERRRAGKDVQLVARRLIVGPWEER